MTHFSQVPYLFSFALWAESPFDHIYTLQCWGICQRRIVGFDVCIGPALPGCTRHRWKLLQNCNARSSGRVTPENNRVIKACDEVDQQPPYQWWDRLTSGLQTGPFYIALVSLWHSNAKSVVVQTGIVMQHVHQFELIFDDEKVHYKIWLSHSCCAI